MCAPTKLNFLFCKRVPEKNTGVCICNNLFTPLERKSSKHSFTWIEIREMVNFELPSCHERRTKKKILSHHEESNLRPLDSALGCFTTEPQRLYYEDHMTRVLHTARISNVDSVTFVDRNKHL